MSRCPDRDNNDRTVRFSATVQSRGANPFVDVPGRARNELLPFAQTGRIRVTGRLSGAEFHATLMPVKPGGHILYVPGGLRAATGVKVGDTVTVDIEPLGAQRIVAPTDLARALDGAAGAADKWDLLPKNINHSCARHSLDEPFREKPAEILRLFDVVRRTVEAMGPVTLVPYRDRVAFMVRVRFGGVRPRRDWIDVNFWLTRRIESPRFQRIETLSPYTHVYTVRVTRASDVDSELTGWLREAYSVGCQEHLQSRRP
ncbi:DUF1905 domain-containing protein [Arthrobacter pascens]|nr:DUF1905 domain-containing protein [Arthrobacter pascens]